MNPHERQQFDVTLQMAVERYAERLEQRNGGAEAARLRLEADPEAEGVWLSDFVDAVFNDFLLDDAAGACFVLQALARRPVPAAGGATIDAHLRALARAAFAELLQRKCGEELARRAGYQAVDMSGR